LSGEFSSGRRALITGAVGIAGLGLSGCDQIVHAPETRNFLKLGQAMSLAAQRSLLSGQRMAREFKERDMSPVFRVNGSREATAPDYLALKANNFIDYRLIIDGLVHTPLALSLAQLRAISGRTQITRHDCVEGWSAIGKWSGVPLHTVLTLAQIDWHAKYAVFHCFDTMPDGHGGVTPYYESIDMFDAFHPQTLLAYDLNGAPLIEGHGAPLRLRVERQLGYKQAKFIKRITLVDRIDNIFRGGGGYWEDVAGYEWYGGI
jgi:DMSO/TMAO reductase YedYZ molybdopterin-dependent catalytic subunit